MGRSASRAAPQSGRRLVPLTGLQREVAAVALKVVLGGFAGDILSSQRVAPAKLIAAGYEFRYPTLPGALAAELTA